MRTALITAAVAAIALWTPSARAQFDAQTKKAKAMKAAGGQSSSSTADTDESEGGEGSDESDGSPMEGEVELKKAGDGSDSAPGQVHTVEKGDTLWDLSQRYLGSPWYWPKVWSYNPEIANPHWIYPGNRVKFSAGGEESPTQVEVGDGKDEPGEVEAGEMIPEDAATVSVAGKIGYVPRSASTMQIPGFVTEKDIEETGTITGSFGQMEMLSYPETGYVRFTRNASSAKVGDSYVVFRPYGEVRHPETNARVGSLTHILGTAKVVKVHDRKQGDEGGQFVTVRIMTSVADIMRGDFLGPYAEPLVRSVAPRANDKELTAMLVGKAVPFLTMSGEQMLVIVDRGSNDGVQAGNVFTIYRQQDGMDMETVVNPSVRDENLPKEDVGTCMAFDVKTTATMCLVTRSLRELVIGDRMEMRSGGASAPHAER